MAKHITLENYEKGYIEGETDEQVYCGVDIGETEYLINKADHLEASYTDGPVAVPARAYEVVSRNTDKRTARVKEITNKGLLRVIAVEFAMQGYEKADKYDPWISELERAERNRIDDSYLEEGRFTQL